MREQYQPEVNNYKMCKTVCSVTFRFPHVTSGRDTSWQIFKLCVRRFLRHSIYLESAQSRNQLTKSSQLTELNQRRHLEDKSLFFYKTNQTNSYCLKCFGYLQTLNMYRGVLKTSGLSPPLRATFRHLRARSMSSLEQSNQGRFCLGSSVIRRWSTGRETRRRSVRWLYHFNTKDTISRIYFKFYVFDYKSRNELELLKMYMDFLNTMFYSKFGFYGE